MRLRNNIFAAAFDYLKREKGIKTQKRLAQLMGVSEDTITRILKDRCEVTEDIITKLQTASGCIFNLQWLRGEDASCMLAEDIDYYKQHPEERLVFDKQQETTSPPPSADWQTDIDVKMIGTDESVLGHVTMPSARFAQNLTTVYSGGVVGTGKSVTITADDTWEDDDIHTW